MSEGQQQPGASDAHDHRDDAFAAGATGAAFDAAAGGGDVSQEDIEVLRRAAALSDEEGGGREPVAEAPVDTAGGASSPPLPEFESGSPALDPKRVTMLNDVKLRVKIELGRSRMLVEDVLKLGEGSVVELDKLAGDPVDVYVNDRLVARGEVLVLNDNFCVRVSDVISNDPHRIST